MKLLVFGKTRLISQDGISASKEDFSSFELLILAYLADHRQTLKTSFADIFWPQSERQNRQKNSSRYLGKLSSKLPQDIISTNETINCWLKTDLDEFLTAIEAGHNHKALKIYQGPFLDNLELNRRVKISEELDSWLINKRYALQIKVRESILKLAEDYIRKQKPKQAKKLALRAFGLPKNDPHTPTDYLRLHDILMASLATEAKQVKNEALNTWGDTAKISENDFSKSQGQAIDRIINKRAYTKLAFKLIGRKKEIANIKKLLLLKKKRLINLLGTGGVGKTSLAKYMINEDEVQIYFNNIYFIDLDKLTAQTDRNKLLLEIARQLGLTISTLDPLDTIIWSFSNNKQSLLIIDNFEQLDRQKGLIIKILELAQNLSIIVTSRKALKLNSEQIVKICSLEINKNINHQSYLAKPEENSALQLLEIYLEENGLELNQNNFQDALDIINYTGGLPLALKLVSAWLLSHSLKEIKKLLIKKIVLENSKLASISERHRSMSRIIKTSIDLLSGANKEAFANLAVFEADFTNEAAEKVSGIDAYAISEFLGSSLLEHKQGTERYHFHPLVLQYATTLAKTDKLDIKHAEYFLDRLELMSAKSKCHNEAISLLSPEILDLAKAWKTAINNLDKKSWSSKIGYLRQLLDKSNNHSLGVELLEHSLKKDETAAILTNLAWLQMRLGSSESEINAHKSLSMQADKKDKSTALIILGSRAGTKRQYQDALKYFWQDHALHEKNSVLQANALVNIALIEIHLERFNDSEGHLIEAIEIFSNKDKIGKIIWARYIYMLVHEAKGNYDKVIDLALQVLPQATQLNLVHQRQAIYHVLVQAYINLGNLQSAMQFLEKINDSLKMLEKARKLRLLAQIANLDKKPSKAKEFLNNTLSIAINLNNPGLVISILIDYLEISPEKDKSQTVLNDLIYYAKHLNLTKTQCNRIKKISLIKKSSKRDELKSQTPFEANIWLTKIIAWLINN